MKYHLPATLAFCCISFLMPHASAENVYKWVDAQGNIHYGDRPQDTAAQTLHVPSPPPVDEASQQRLEALIKQGKGTASKKEKETATAKSAATSGPNEEEMEKNCSIAKENLAKLEGASALLFEADKEGNRRILPLEERSKTTESMRKETERWCK